MPISHLIRINILPVVLRSVSVLNCEFGAVMKAGEAHHALFLDPDGFAVRDSDGRHRAVLLAQTASYTAVFHDEIRGPACSVVINRARDHLRDDDRRSR